MNIIVFPQMPKNNRIPLTDKRAEHIIKVLRLKENDTFKMGIANKSEGTATITKISGKEIEFSYKPSGCCNMFPVTLIAGQVRPICMKRILREATSLGVGKIILTGTQTGEKSYAESGYYKKGEYKETLYDGAMQSGHAGIPEVVFSDNVQDALKHIDRKDTSLVLLDNVTGSAPLREAEILQNAVIAIGSERGWTDEERKIFTDNGFKAMTIGSRILRTETACSVGLGLLLSRMRLL